MTVRPGDLVNVIEPTLVTLENLYGEDEGSDRFYYQTISPDIRCRVIQRINNVIMCWPFNGIGMFMTQVWNVRPDERRKI